MMWTLVLCLAAAPEPQGDEAFVDAWAERTQRACRAPGLAVSVVRGGDIVVAKGYGFADVEAKVPVDGERTRFPIASATKSITATAVMQLVAEGKLALDADVNLHLTAFKVPATFPEHVTLHQLLTHTSGLDDSLIGAAATSAADITPLDRFLAAHPPVRVARPGELWSYSNRNYSLAGHLLERASGQSYARYVEEHVFAPLEMRHSGFAVPADARELARAYEVTDSTVEPTLQPWTNDVPAGGMNTSAGDMARFLRAHLGHGPLGPDTLKPMHESQYRFHPDLPGMTYGFMETEHAGARVLMHEGNMGAVGALVYLVPELELGVFAAVNGAGDSCDLASLATGLIDRTRPPPPPSPVVAARSTPSFRALEGTYRSSRYPHATLEKVSVVLGLAREVEVHAEPDGTLKIGRGRYTEVAPLLFRRVDGEGQIAFKDGALSNGMATTYVRVPWHGGLTVHRLVFVLSVATFLFVAVAWPLAALWRRWRGRARAEPLVRRARLSSWLLALGSLVFLGGLAAPFFGPYGPYWLLFEIPPSVKAVLALPFVLAVVVVATVTWAALAWKRRAGTRAGRVGYSLAGLAGVAFMSFLTYWNLVGFRF